MNLSLKQIETLKHIAKSAGDILMKYYKQDITVSTKTDFTPVTIADTLSNDFIVNELRKNFPDFGIFSEEGPREWKNFTFTIDPLAGTKNFISGNDKFDVMIGLLEKGNPIFGVIYNPVNNTTWFGGVLYDCYFEDLNGIKQMKIKIENKSEENILVTRRKFSEDFGIAKKFYGNGAEWRRIWNVNTDKIKNPNLIYPLQILKIP